MAHLKCYEAVCPKCRSPEKVYCERTTERRVDSEFSVCYVLVCKRCNCVVGKPRTVFSEAGKGIKIHGLSCPFCRRGRKSHHFYLGGNVGKNRNGKVVKMRSRKAKRRVIHERSGRKRVAISC